MAQQANPRILETGNIGKLLLEYSIPAIIGMTITSIYNIIDSIFIGHGIGAMAISGLAVTFPLMNLVVAFCVLIASGGATISSIRLGQKDLDGATAVLCNTQMLCVFNSVVFGGLFLIFLTPILNFFGASEGTLPYARDFMQIILLGTPITYTMIGLNNIMRSTGYPRKAMHTSLVTVVANAILAPIFIFVLHWGIRGAALATVLSQVIGMIWVINHFRNPKNFIHFRPGFWHFDKHIIKSIFSIGMSPFAMNVTACVIVILINNEFQRYGGDMAIGAYGISNRIQMLFVMVVVGLTMGMQPIVGYNFGAKKYDRMRRTLWLSIIVGAVFSTIGFLICELFPGAVSAMFTNNEELTRLSITGLRISSLMFPVIGAQIVVSNFFQSIGKAGISIFLSLSRQLLFLLPCLILFPPIYGLNGIWASMPVSDGIATITTFGILFYYIKKEKAKQPTV